MKQFATIEKLDTGILYCLELAASISVLLLAFGLIASMANVLTKGAVLTDHLWMQEIWAWTQCIAIDASVAGTIIRTFRYYRQGERVKTWLYGLLSVLLLFTAAIVSNIEAVQQTLNISLDNAYLHVFIPVELLIWIRSIAIVLLIVAHAMRHIQLGKSQETAEESTAPKATPELIETLRQLLSEVSVMQQQEPAPLQLPEPQAETNPLERMLQELDRLLPNVSRQEIAAVVSAYRTGTARRDMCRTLHWGAGKYTTIVKPVLDAYEQLKAAG